MTELSDFVLRVKDLTERAERGITVGIGGSVLDGFVGPESTVHQLKLTEARLLDGDAGPRRGIPDANIPLANVTWWAPKTGRRTSKVDRLVDGLLNDFRFSDLPISEGPATLVLSGMVIMGEVTKIGAFETEIPSELSLSPEEAEAFNKRKAEVIDKTFLAVKEATIIMSNQIIPKTAPKLYLIIRRDAVVGWTPTLLSVIFG